MWRNTRCRAPLFRPTSYELRGEKASDLSVQIHREGLTPTNLSQGPVWTAQCTDRCLVFIMESRMEQVVAGSPLNQACQGSTTGTVKSSKWRILRAARVARWARA